MHLKAVTHERDYESESTRLTSQSHHGWMLHINVISINQNNQHTFQLLDHSSDYTLRPIISLLNKVREHLPPVKNNWHNYNPRITPLLVWSFGLSDSLNCLVHPYVRVWENDRIHIFLK